MYTSLRSGEWGVLVVVTQDGMPHINVDVTSDLYFLF